MTTAILHHNIRNSSREVSVTPTELGLNLVSVGGEKLGLWPYAAIRQLPDSRTQFDYGEALVGGRLQHPAYLSPPDADYMAEFTLNHNDMLTLRVFDPVLIEHIIAQAPFVRSQRGLARRDRWFAMWLAIPVGARTVICLLPILAILYGWSWLAS